jgi:PKD repeat protein
VATPATGTAPLIVTFSSAGSVDPDGTLQQYSWHFGDGATATGETATHTYVSAGTFVAGLTVTDTDGASDSIPVIVTVTEPAPNRPPVAVASAAPTSGAAPLVVAFSSAGSGDPDGSLARYAWSFGNGAASAHANPTYVYTSPGVYTASLTVTDENGASSTQPVTITVAPPPTATLMYVSGVQLAVMGESPARTGVSTVTVLDDAGAPVPSALVTGYWSGSVASGFTYAMTDQAGRATFTTNVPDEGSLTFTVLLVSKRRVAYDTSRNGQTAGTVRY